MENRYKSETYVYLLFPILCDCYYDDETAWIDTTKLLLLLLCILNIVHHLNFDFLCLRVCVYMVYVFLVSKKTQSLIFRSLRMGCFLYITQLTAIFTFAFELNNERKTYTHFFFFCSLCRLFFHFDGLLRQSGCIQAYTVEHKAVHFAILLIFKAIQYLISSFVFPSFIIFILFWTNGAWEPTVHECPLLWGPTFWYFQHIVCLLSSSNLFSMTAYVWWIKCIVSIYFRRLYSFLFRVYVSPISIFDINNNKNDTTTFHVSKLFKIPNILYEFCTCTKTVVHDFFHNGHRQGKNMVFIK